MAAKRSARRPASPLGWRSKTRPYASGDAVAYVRAHMAADPAFAQAIEEELARMQLGAKVRALRQKRKLTQEQLAKRAQTDQSFIAKIEAGRVPKLDVVAKVAHALGCSLELRFVPARSA